MKTALDYIEKKNAEFATRKIFGWLGNSEIAPEERLAFAPYMAHFVFSFMDINRFVLRDMEETDPLQNLVNVHTYEDSHHWPWYLSDLKKLKFNKQMTFADALYFVWGDHCIKSRMITYEMTAIAKALTPKEKIVLVEIIEKTGNVFLGCTADVCGEAGRGGDLMYYGDNHLACETGHTMGTDDIERLLHDIELTPDEQASAVVLIDRIYELYHDFVDEMYEFVSSRDYQELLTGKSYSSHINRNMRPTELKLSAEQLSQTQVPASQPAY